MKLVPKTIGIGIITTVGALGLTSAGMSLIRTGEQIQTGKDNPRIATLESGKKDSDERLQRIQERNTPHPISIAIGTFFIDTSKVLPITEINHGSIKTGSWDKTGKFGKIHPTKGKVIQVTNPYYYPGRKSYLGFPDDNGNNISIDTPSINRDNGVRSLGGYDVKDCITTTNLLNISICDGQTIVTAAKVIPTPTQSHR